MGSFITQVDVDSKTLDFSFIRVYTTNGIRYYVTVIDSMHKSYLFHMEQRSGRWQIIDAPKVPQWIHDVESQLAEAIQKNEPA